MSDFDHAAGAASPPPQTLPLWAARSTVLRLTALLAFLLAALGYEPAEAQDTAGQIGAHYETIALALIGLHGLLAAALERARGTRALTLFGWVVSEPGEG